MPTAAPTGICDCPDIMTWRVKNRGRMRLELSRRTDLAVRALRHLAAAGDRVKRPALAAAIGTSPDFLARVMTDLVAEGWVRSEPGRNGGYELATDPRTISMLQLIAATEELDRRGYFTWIRGGVELLDRIITGFDEEDMQALSDNVVLIFETVKEMTQPEVMRMLQRSARMMREDVEPPKKLSMFRLMRELRDPEVKLAIYRTLTMLKGMSGPTVADPTDTTDQPSEHSAKEE